MNQFFLDDLWKCSNQTLLNQNACFHDFFFDTRNIIKGEDGVYFCFERIYEKAKKYIQQAIRRKVIAIVSPFHFQDDITPILVDKNPLKLLQKFSKNHLQKFSNLQKISITGSNGKTIVKEWLYSCLKDDISIVRSPKSYNSQIGVPISVLQTNKSHQMGIFECGISTFNEMKNLQEIINPQIGILTNIQNAHIENFESKKHLISEKCFLFKDSEKLFFSTENDRVANYLKKEFKKKSLIGIGTSKNSRGSDIELIWQQNNSIKIRFFSKIYHFKIPMNDPASISNLLIVISFLYDFGFSVDKIQKKIIELTPVSMRLELKKGILNSTVLNDTFNADLSSIKIALEKLSHLPNTRKLVVITDIFQSVKQQYNVYKKIFNLLNVMKLHHIFLVGKFIVKYQKLSKNPSSIFESTEDLIQNFNSKIILNSAILIKGSRVFELEKFVKFIENKSHDTFLEINLDAILHNIKLFKTYLNPNTKMMAMVKANSYGMGSSEIAKFLQHHEIDYLGVAYADEGAMLRKNGIYLPIMVMNPERNSYDIIIDHHLEPEIYSLRVLKLFGNKLKEKTYTQDFPIHIKIDSGMHRLGFQDNQIEELAKELKNHSNFYIKSIFTHLATTDNKNCDFTIQQIKKFNKLYDQIVSNLSYKPLKHSLNSHGIINYSDYQFDMVRIGIGMYGYISDELIRKKSKNVITLKTKISQIISLKKGESVGYNASYYTNRNTYIATLPIGYADGIFRKLGNGNFQVLIGNKKAKIIGSICMDMMMVELHDVSCKEGDEVIIYGQENPIDKAAKLCETIPYEILTSISNRVKRVFVKD